MARKETRLTKLFDSAARNSLKKFLTRTSSWTNPSLLINPSITGKFFAIEPSKNEYVIEFDNSRVEISTIDGLPVPPKSLRIGEMSEEQFISGGKVDFEQMMSIVKPFLSQESGDHKRVLEFGCSSGRMIRNLHSTSDFNDVWGVDLASEHIYWCQEHLKPINFLTVTMTPHLPFEDNYFDFIYAGSVFTHIDDLALTWLWELNRILKKGGILYITIHDEHTLDYFKQNQSTDTFQKMILNTKAYKLFTKSNAKKFVVGRSLMSHVFYNSGKLISDLEQYFEVLNFVPKSYQKYQSSLTLKK